MKRKIKIMVISIISILVLAIIFIIIAHYNDIIKTKDNLEIVQIPNNDQDKINIARRDNSPVVINNFSPILNINKGTFNFQEEVFGFKFDTMNNITNLDMNISEVYDLYETGKGGCLELSINSDNSTNNQFNQKLQEYISPISMYSDITLSLLPKNYTSQLHRRYYNLNLYIIENGSVTFQLYHPKYQKYLKNINDKSDTIDTQLWEINGIISNDAKYIEIIIRKGQAVIIPYQWIHKYTCLENSSIINLTSTDITGSIIFNLEKIRYHIC